MPEDAPRTPRQSSLFRLLARRTGVQDALPTPMTATMERRHVELQTPYAVRRAEAERELLEALRMEEGEGKVEGMRIFFPREEPLRLDEASEVRPEEEI